MPSEQTPAVPQAPKPAAKAVIITPSAIKPLIRLAASRGSTQGGLRLAVKGGGCSGLTLLMEWADAPGPKDRVFELDGGRVIVDGKSLLYLSGSELTYEESFMSSGFKLNNPNVKAECGCGSSFGV
jgi:iron-sulfur cluster assembly protein